MSRIQGLVLSTLAAALAACSGAPQQEDAAAQGDPSLRLRNLTETADAAPAKASYKVEGELIPTPSDTATRYYLLRQRRPLTGETLFANLREERGGKVSFARIELSCEKRLFHIVAVGTRRSSVEFKKNGDGPLRGIDGLPLRQEIASFVCDRAGTPLAAANSVS